MEINPKLTLINYIMVLDDILPKNAHEVFFEIYKNLDDKYFNKGSIVSENPSEALNTDKRNVKLYDFTRSHNFTSVHWYYLLGDYFMKKIHHYNRTTKLDVGNVKIVDLSLLKYEVGGKYVEHYDHCRQCPRTLSLIYFVNEDYEGGDLIFNPGNSGEYLTIPKKQNRLVIWPSDALYRHAVTPVTKGERYTIVSWAL